MKDKLSGKEYDILLYILDNPEMNQSELANNLGISQSYISRLYNRVKTKVKNELYNIDF